MILTGACCSLPDFLNIMNMESYNKGIFYQYDIYNATIRAHKLVLSKIKHQIIFQSHRMFSENNSSNGRACAKVLDSLAKILAKLKKLKSQSANLFSPN